MPKLSLRCNKDFSSKTVLFIILAGDFPFDIPQDLSKLIESLLVMRELNFIEHLKK
jgi:hypothetical protein